MNTNRFVSLAAGPVVAASLATAFLTASPKPRMATEIPLETTTSDTVPGVWRQPDQPRCIHRRGVFLEVGFVHVCK